MIFDLLCFWGKSVFFLPVLIISYLNQKLREWYFMMFILQLEHNDSIIKYMFNISSGPRYSAYKRPNITWNIYPFSR